MFALKAFLYPKQETVVIFVPKIVIWEAWFVHFGTLGSYFGILGTPWATLGAAGRTPGDPGRIFNDFGMILGLHFGSFSGTEG